MSAVLAALAIAARSAVLAALAGDRSPMAPTTVEASNVTPTPRTRGTRRSGGTFHPFPRAGLVGALPGGRQPAGSLFLAIPSS